MGIRIVASQLRAKNCAHFVSRVLCGNLAGMSLEQRKCETDQQDREYLFHFLQTVCYSHWNSSFLLD